MNNLIFVFETMECDWDSAKVIRGIFSDVKEAVEYIKSNYYLLDDDYGRDVCILDYPIKGDVFRQYGYEVHPDDVSEDDDGLYCWYEDVEDGDVYSAMEYLNTETVFTLRGVVLDDLLK